MSPRIWLGSALVAALCVSGTVAAAGAGPQSGPRGPVAVRDVVVRDAVVREVRVPPPPRPSTGMARPFLPDAISRPDRTHFAAPSIERYWARRSHSWRGHRGSGAVGYPVGFPVYPFVFDQPTYTFYDPRYAPPATLESSASSATVVAGSPSLAAIDCGVSPEEPAPCGGLIFDVVPTDAQVSVEGVFVGSVNAFPPSRPLALAPGVHYVEVRRPGYRTVTFELTVAAGAIVPYQGALEPLRTR